MEPLDRDNLALEYKDDVSNDIRGNAINAILTREVELSDDTEIETSSDKAAA